MSKAAYLVLAALCCSTPALASATSAAPKAALFDRQIAAAKSAIMADPAKALHIADSALETAREMPDSRQARLSIATAQWLAGEAHLFLNETDQAEPLIGTALATANEFGRGTKLQGDLMRSRGAVAASRGRVQEALAAYQQAYKIFVAAHEARSQSIELQDIGQIFDDAGDYERALGYYSQAAEAYDQDPSLLLANYNNRAEVLRKLKRWAPAEDQYKAALKQARVIGSTVLQVRILCNLADVQAQRGEVAAAQSTVERAASLSHAGEAAGWQPFVLGTAAKVAIARRDLPSAAALFDRMFTGIKIEGTDVQFREFHQAASETYAALGRSELALAHLRAFQRLNDAARDLTASTSAQLASARFDFANQNLRISTLKAKQLQQEVQLERQHARLRSIIIAAILAIAAAVVGFLSFALITGRRSRDRLRRVNTDLERALRAKTDFLAMTSHEIRTPLNGILGMTQVMLQGQDLDPATRDRIRLVHGAGETMSALVDDILDVAKMEAGSVEVIEEDVDLGSLIRQVTSLWQDQAVAKGVQLQSASEDVPALVRTDPTRLRQILFNLLSNAVKFTAQGSITISAEFCAEQIVIKVTDTGIGIDPAQHDLIFEPFQQADASTTRQYGGTGLGLAICRNLAGALGGSIAVESALTHGAEFTVLLPLKVSVVAPDDAPVIATATNVFADARILLVDANLLAQGMISVLLDPHVAGVDTASTDHEAVQKLASDGISHVIVDTGSAGGAACTSETLTALIDAAHRRHARVTLLAGAASPIPFDALEEMGADQIVLKPVGGGALIKRLSELYRVSERLAA